MRRPELQFQKQPSRVVLKEKGILKISSKFAGEHLCQIAISIKLQIILRHGCSAVNLLHIFRTPFPKNTSGAPRLQFLFMKKVVYTDAYILLSPNRGPLKISLNSQENICSRVPFSIKLQASGLQLYLKKRFRRRFFSVNFAKFLRTTVFYRAPPVVSLIIKSLRTQTCKYNKYASVQMPRVNRR